MLRVLTSYLQSISERVCKELRTSVASGEGGSGVGAFWLYYFLQKVWVENKAPWVAKTNKHTVKEAEAHPGSRAELPARPELMRLLSPREPLIGAGLQFLTSGGRFVCRALVVPLTASPSLFHTREFQDSFFPTNDSKLGERSRCLVGSLTPC